MDGNLKLRLTNSKLYLSMLIGEIDPQNTNIVNVLRYVKRSVEDAMAFVDANGISQEVEDLLNGDEQDDH